MMATSTGRAPRLKSRGNSESRTGVKSARPSCTALRMLALMNIVFTRRWPSICGPT
jgi:hypothetical protein